jgi:hypothetical protein
LLMVQPAETIPAIAVAIATAEILRVIIVPRCLSSCALRR